MDGRFVLHPVATYFEGRDISDLEDDTGSRFVRRMIVAAGNGGHDGLTRYRWYTPGDSKQMSDKLSYVRRFAPYDWFIGSGDYLFKWEQMQQREALDYLRSLRFGGTGAFAVLDREGRLLSWPEQPTLDGTRVADLPAEARQMFERVQALAAEGVDSRAMSGSIPPPETVSGRRRWWPRLPRGTGYWSLPSTTVK